MPKPLTDAQRACKAGRPTLYRDEFAVQCRKLCDLGATDLDLAAFFGVALKTIDTWRGKHEEFALALNAGRERADAGVERSLYQRAMGYSHPAVKMFLTKEGTVVREEYIEHHAPDTVACIFWLKNRRSADWRDARELSVRKVDTLNEDQARAMAAAMIEAAQTIEGETIPVSLPGLEHKT